MDMEVKGFGVKEKLVSAKLKVFRLLGLIDSLGDEGSNASSTHPVFTGASLSPEEALRYWHELRKAEALLHWKRWHDQPK